MPLEVLVIKNYSLGFSVWYIHTAHYTSIAFINRSYLVSLFLFPVISRATTLTLLFKLLESRFFNHECHHDVVS